MKKSFKYILLILSLTLLVSCGNDKDIPKEKNSTNKIEQEDTKESEEIKENQEEKDTKISDKKLEKQLKEYRIERDKDKYSGTMNGAVTDVDPNLPIDGYDELLEFVPLFKTEDETKAVSVAIDYILNELRVDIKSKVKIYGCVDPRIKKIYKPGEDKGKLSNYENENIWIGEYLDGDEWKYIFLGRDSKDSDWKIVHTGSSYK